MRRALAGLFAVVCCTLAEAVPSAAAAATGIPAPSLRSFAQLPVPAPSALTGTAAIEVRVYGQPGYPAPVGGVTLASVPHEPAKFRQLSGDGAGVYRAEGLPAGMYKVMAGSIDTSPYLEPEAVVTVADGEQRTVELRPAIGGVITGVLTNSKGQPVAGTSVQARPGDSFAARFAETAADGSFRIVGIPPGKRLIEAEDHYYPGVRSRKAAKFLTIFAGRTRNVGRMRVLLDGRLRVSTRTRAGRAVPYQSVCAEPVRGGERTCGITSSDDGTIDDLRVPPGRYRVVVGRRSVVEEGVPRYETQWYPSSRTRAGAKILTIHEGRRSAVRMTMRQLRPPSIPR